MDQLNPVDMTFLDVDDPGAPLAIAAVAVVDGPAPGMEEFLAMLAPRVAQVPRFRQRLVAAPYDVVRPVWVEVPDIELTTHVRHATLPTPGRHADLEALVGDLVTFPMRHDRPLWDMWLLDGLADGRWAVLARVHHAAVDGVGGALMLLHLFEVEPDEWRPAPPEPEPEEAPAPPVTESGTDVDGAPDHTMADAWDDGGDPHGPSAEVRAIAGAIDHQVRTTAERLAGLVEQAVAGSLSPTTVTRRLSDTIRGITSLVTAATEPASPTLRGPVGPGRRWATASVPLADFRPIRRRFGGTLNDVALTAVAAALRDLLVSRGEPVAGRAVKVFVPFSQRPTGDETVNNQVSGVVATLPVDTQDPVDRLRAVTVRLRRLKQSGGAAALNAVVQAAAWAPTPLARATVRLGAPYVIGLVDTITTNVAGPPFPLYLGGREVRAIYPYVPIREPLRMVVALFSYNGALYVGVTGDTASLPDLERVPRTIVRSVAELLDRARSGAREASPAAGDAAAAEGHAHAHAHAPTGVPREA